MKAWHHDADTVSIDDNWDSMTLVRNSSISNFLNTKNDQKFFVIAPKGYGKTLLLKAKSHIYREKKEDYVFIPKNDLCEKLTYQTVSFSVDDLNKYRLTTHWTELWKLSLSILILRNVNIILPDKIQKVIGKTNKLSDILNIFLREKSRLYEYLQLLYTDINPELSNIETNVAVFVDNIDEAFDKHVGDNYFKNFSRESSKEVLHEDVWVAAQLGFIEASKQLNCSNRRIRIFGSIRLEAYNMNSAQTALQTDSYSTILSYTYSELKEIFEKNISKMDKKDLVNPLGESPTERFLGFSYVQHRFVKDKNGSIKSEEAFDYIYRHTFRRPREIVIMGQMLSFLDSKTRSNTSEFRNKVKAKSLELFTQYKKEFIPYFDNEKFIYFAKRLKSNVISRQEAEDIYIKSGLGHVFSYYYKCGIIGYVNNDEFSNEAKQVFLDVATQLCKDEDDIPYSTHYLIHPATYNFLRGINSNFSWNTSNIIGYNHSFYHGV